jgi:serine protease Do
MASFRLRLFGLAFTLTSMVLLVSLPVATSAATDDVKVPVVFAKPMPESIEDLKAIETHVRIIVARVMPAVVNVKSKAQGSGVVISKDGLVLTAAHVSGTPGTVFTITFPDGKVVKGKSLGQNTDRDSGLIKITDEGDYPICEMAKSGELKKDQWCIAIGHPGGLKQGRTPPVRLGRISEPDAKFVKTDCTLVGGDSGGPLFDMYGRVIGIHSRIGNPITANQHVPIDTFHEDWARLVKGDSWPVGKGGQGGKGAGPKGVPGQANGLEFTADGKELTITAVKAETSAEKAGLKVNDVITAINGKTVGTAEQFQAEIARAKAGDEVTFDVRRGVVTLKLKLVLEKAG